MEKKRNKKKLTTLIALLMCAVLTFGIAGSLAYYFDTTSGITNKFSWDSSENNGDDETEGNVSITMVETIGGDVSATVEDGESETIELLPGISLYKEVEVTISDSSLDCYVFVLVEDEITSNEENVNNYENYLSDYLVFVQNVDNDAWGDAVASVGNYALYMYPDAETAGDGVTFSLDIDVEGGIKDASELEWVNECEIVYYSYAIQYENVSEETAISEAIEYFNKELNIKLTNLSAE